MRQDPLKEAEGHEGGDDGHWLKTVPTEMAILASHLLREAAQHEYASLRRHGEAQDPIGAPDRPARVVPPSDPNREDHFHNFEDEEPDLPQDEDGDDDGSVDSVSQELAAYDALESLETPFKQPDMKQNPLLWWRARASNFPILSSLSRKYLAVPAASAAVERMFSYTGNRVSKKDTNLGDETLLSMMMIRSLSKFIDKYEGRYLPAGVQE